MRPIRFKKGLAAGKQYDGITLLSGRMFEEYERAVKEGRVFYEYTQESPDSSIQIRGRGFCWGKSKFEFVPEGIEVEVK